MTSGFPIEWLGPVCDGCGWRHHANEPHTRILTSDEADQLLALSRADHLPDKLPTRSR